jgi:hypothetical protein
MTDRLGRRARAASTVPGVIRCVLYAAKSTEDLRGSIPGQLRDCRETVAKAEDRIVEGEYSDEACSAYHGDRGPGLVGALRHAEELARLHGTAELWAQHSDRLARGDGRSAREPQNAACATRWEAWRPS